MTWLAGVLGFIVGSALGSFSYATALRLEKNDNLISGRSACPHCQKPLRWFELVPVLSFLYQGSKCSTCKHKLSLAYLGVEVGMGLLIASLVVRAFSLNLSLNWLIIGSLLLTTLLILSIFDFLTHTIDDRILLIAGGLILVLQGFILSNYGLGASSMPLIDMLIPWPLGWSQIFLTALLATFPFLSLFLLTAGRGIGLGDAKVAFLIGLSLSPAETLIAFILTALSGGLIGIIYFIKTRQLRMEIPYVPFMFVGVAMTLLFGNELISWYLGILG